MKKYFLFLALTPLLFGAGTSNQATFFKGSLNSAKTKAAKEGKITFVEFVASYCYLCKLMDETTWKDEKIIRFTEENYVLMKVNIEDFDGFALRNKYNIKVLPTMLVFNSQGKILGRYEESMGIRRMMDVLQSHNKAENKIKTSLKEKPPQAETAIIPTPEPVPEPGPGPEISIPALEVPDEMPIPHNSGKSDIDVSAPLAPSGTGLFEFTVKKIESKGFGVQIGVFGQYGNVLREAEKLQNQFSKPVLVNINELNGKTVYRVMVGGNASRTEAEAFRSHMKSLGYEGLVKDLNMFK